MHSLQQRKDLEVFLVVGAVNHLMVPLLMRTGLVDLAEDGIRVGLQHETAALSAERGLPKGSVAQHVSRSNVWIPPRSTAERVKQELVERDSEPHNFQQKLAILDWLVKRHNHSFTPAEVARELAGRLGMARTDFPGLLRVYKTLGYLIEPEEGRFQAAGAEIKIPLKDFEQRKALVLNILAGLLPLCEAYLEGNAGAVYASGSLPMELWRTLRSDIGRYCAEAVDAANRASDSDEMSAQPRTDGVVMVLAGVPAWTGSPK